MKDETMVTVTATEYNELRCREAFLSALEAAGVDNWSGYEVAQEIYDESYAGDDED